MGRLEQILWRSKTENYLSSNRPFFLFLPFPICKSSVYAGVVAKFNLEIFKRPVLWYVVAGWGGQQLDLVRYKIIISFQIWKLPFGNMRSAWLTRLQWFTLCRTWDHALYCNVIRCHILYCVLRIPFFSFPFHVVLLGHLSWKQIMLMEYSVAKVQMTPKFQIDCSE